MSKLTTERRYYIIDKGKFKGSDDENMVTQYLNYLCMNINPTFRFERTLQTGQQ